MSSSDLRTQLATLAKVVILILPVSIGFGMLLDEGRLSVAVVTASVGTAMIIGVPIFAFEMLFVAAPWGAGFRRLPLAPFMVIRVTVWGVWILVGSLIANLTVWVTPAPDPLAEPDFWWTFVFSLAVSASVTFMMTVSQLLGPGVLGDLIIGRYHRPRTDERAVAFIDLKGSTALADRIGPERFFDAMSRFAALVSDEVRASGGKIYGYVGDEVIVTWDGPQAGDLTPAAAALVRLKARLAVDGESWERDFGTVPDFRASLHVGPVVAGEIGDAKRAIVLLGDTMNVGARLEQAARDLGSDIVCSVDAARRIGPILGVELRPLAPVTFRGKADPMLVVSVSRVTEVPT